MIESQHITSAAGGTETARAAAAASPHAFDAGDFGAAGRLLAPECELEDGALHARGAAAVLAVYRAAASWAERGFDEVRHSSDVECAGADARAVVTTYVMRVPG